MNTYKITLRYEATYTLEVEAENHEEAITQTAKSLEIEIESKGETLIKDRVHNLREIKESK